MCFTTAIDAQAKAVAVLAQSNKANDMYISVVYLHNSVFIGIFRLDFGNYAKFGFK